MGHAGAEEALREGEVQVGRLPPGGGGGGAGGEGGVGDAGGGDAGSEGGGGDAGGRERRAAEPGHDLPVDVRLVVPEGGGLPERAPEGCPRRRLSQGPAALREAGGRPVRPARQGHRSRPGHGAQGHDAAIVQFQGHPRLELGQRESGGCLQHGWQAGGGKRARRLPYVRLRIRPDGDGEDPHADRLAGRSRTSAAYHPLPAGGGEGAFPALLCGDLLGQAPGLAGPGLCERLLSAGDPWRRDGRLLPHEPPRGPGGGPAGGHKTNQQGLAEPRHREHEHEQHQ
mmetsp:Transcript_48963/g.129433  ORF Transcript_48963/g.129433 Transcript_48963/m.129433 type:complete len:284 (-) Transcript_48963:1038-1889(-)